MSSIHPTAIVEHGADLEDGVEVGPYVVIGPNVRIGADTKIMPHVVIDGYTTIGSKCTIYPFACIGTQTQDLKYQGAQTFVEVGDGTIMREYVTINAGTNEGEITKVGAGCVLMTSSHIAHASTVGKSVILGNCAGVAGEVTVGDHAIISPLTGVHQFCRVGTHCFVGGCSRITQDCPPYMVVEGNPASVRGTNSVGLKRHGVDDSVRKSLKQAHRILFREDLSVRNAVDKIKSELEMCSEVQHLLEFIEEADRGIIR